MKLRLALVLAMLSASSPAGAEEAVRVAVLDSGISAGWQTHPEFEGTTLAAWKDFHEGSVSPVDPLGHGTAVASLAVGATLGTAPDAELIVGRVLDRFGRTTWDVVVAGIDWAVEQRADVINVSIWSPDLQPSANVEIARAVARARSAGVLTVWIAGNGYGPDGSPWPSTALVGASSPQALVVGSADATGRASSWSRPDPEVLAHGEDVLVATLQSGYYHTRSGTSYAAPRIAGAAAQLILDGAPRDPDWLEWVILHAAEDDPDVGYPDEGYGFFGASSSAAAREIARGARPMPAPDSRDAFHAASTTARVAVSPSAPAGVLPPLPRPTP